MNKQKIDNFDRERLRFHFGNYLEKRSNNIEMEV